MMKPLTAKKLDELIARRYSVVFHCVEVAITDLGKIRRLALAAYAAEPTEASIDAALTAALPIYRRN